MSADTEPDTTLIDSRYGERRYGDPAEPPTKPRRALDDIREQRHPDEITPREALGAGLKLDDNFDFIIKNGTLQTMAGIKILGRDLAFRISGTGMQMLGDRITNRLLSEFEFRVAEIITDDERVKRVYRIAAHKAGRDTVELVAGLIAEDSQYHELIFPIQNGITQPPQTKMRPE